MSSVTYQEQKDFMIAQVHKIEIYKWVQGERQCSDPGELFVHEWVYNNAKKFRDEWNTSMCKTCSSHHECGYNALTECDNYEEMGYN